MSDLGREDFLYWYQVVFALGRDICGFASLRWSAEYASSRLRDICSRIFGG
jgi:hypothetical protein